MSEILLNTAYFPNIQYLSKFIINDIVKIEINDTFQKQTYRNRCCIATANGILNLSVPVARKNHTLTKDVTIDYSENWQIKHQRAIMSAYKNSAFYEYYTDEFQEFFSKKEKYLIDLNSKILERLLKILGIAKSTEYTSEFISNVSFEDFRDKIHPKESKKFVDNKFAAPNYYQVFSERYGFLENLSSLDLLFNEGPTAILKIQESIKA